MFRGIWKTMRPHQWVKNLFVLAPAVFAKDLTHPDVLSRAVYAFVLFCFASSAVYFMNDLLDAQADRAHPIKRKRAIASGVVSKELGIGVATSLFATAIFGTIPLGLAFAGSLLGYILLNVAYSFGLKRMAYVDVLCIAAGFEFRVLGGTFAAQVPATGYLLVVTFLLAAFLGFGKRLHELSQGPESYQQRAVLRGYSKSALTTLLFVTAGLTLATYTSYTFDAHTVAFFETRKLPWSIPFAVFGVGRFLYLVRHRPAAESPTEEMLEDWPFLLNLGLWGVAVFASIYLV